MEINGVFVDVIQHVLGNPIKATFGVSHGSGRVAVDGTEVPLPVHERIAKRKFLCHSHHGVVNRLIAVRMVFPHHFTDGAGRFAELFIGGMTAFKHPVKHATVNGLESVSCIRKRPTDDHGHGVVDVRIFHLGVQRVVEDDLAGHCFAVVGGVVVLFRCQGWSPPWRVVQ